MTTLNWWIISSNLEYCDVIRRNASGPNQQPERSAPLGAWSSSSPWWSSARSAPAFRSRSQGIGDDDDDDDDDDDAADDDDDDDDEDDDGADGDDDAADDDDDDDAADDGYHDDD